jgi:hypothetical protein
MDGLVGCWLDGLFVGWMDLRKMEEGFSFEQARRSGRMRESVLLEGWVLDDRG